MFVDYISIANKQNVFLETSDAKESERFFDLLKIPGCALILVHCVLMQVGESTAITGIGNSMRIVFNILGSSW